MSQQNAQPPLGSLLRARAEADPGFSKRLEGGAEGGNCTHTQLQVDILLSVLARLRVHYGLNYPHTSALFRCGAQFVTWESRSSSEPDLLQQKGRG